MSTGQPCAPPAAVSRPSVKLWKRTVRKIARQDVTNIAHLIASTAELGRRLQSGQRVHRALPVHPGSIGRIDRKIRCRWWRDFPAITMIRSARAKRANIGHIVGEAFAVFGNKGVDIDGSRDYSTRNAVALASGRLSPLLALEIVSTGRAPADRDGIARADPADEHGEFALGCAAHPRRTAQARV